MKIKIAVVTPIYQEELNSNETNELKHSYANLKYRDIFFISPKNLNLKFYRHNFPSINYIFLKTITSNRQTHTANY